MAQHIQRHYDLVVLLPLAHLVERILDFRYCGKYFIGGIELHQNFREMQHFGRDAAHAEIDVLDTVKSLECG